MWEQSMVESTHRSHARNARSLMASASVQALLLAAALIVPLVRTAHMEWAPVSAAVPLAMPVLPSPMVAARAPSTMRTHWQTLEAYTPPTMAAPPRVVARPATPLGGVAPPAPQGFYALPLPLPEPTPGVAPAPPPELPVHAPIAVGGEIEASRCLACPAPAYPAFARQAHIEGVVILHALISAAGLVEHVQRVSGNAMLAAAAEQAVRKWRYQPLSLDGQPVAVACDITLHFSLQP